jgi:hypothetical protein
MREAFMFFAGLILFVVFIIGIALWLSSAKCNAQGRSFEAVEWGPIQGCMVLHKKRWLPLKNIRGFDDKG